MKIPDTILPRWRLVMKLKSPKINLLANSQVVGQDLVKCLGDAQVTCIDHFREIYLTCQMHKPAQTCEQQRAYMVIIHPVAKD
jgi:hypothetical protein